jgi:hypothetical protein
VVLTVAYKAASLNISLFAERLVIDRLFALLVTCFFS